MARRCRSDRAHRALGKAGARGTRPRFLVAVKSRMNRTTDPHPARAARPLLVRAAHAWYSWAVLAVTVAVTYLAANGHLRVGAGPNLRAAPPDSAWKPSTPTTPQDPSRIVLTPSRDADDPFKPAPPSAAPPKFDKVDPPTPAPAPKRSDPFVTPASDVRPAPRPVARPNLTRSIRRHRRRYPRRAVRTRSSRPRPTSSQS